MAALFMFISVLSVLAIMPFITMAHYLAQKDLKSICSNTTDTEGCLKLFKSDSRTENIGLSGLAEVTIDIAVKRLNETHRRLDSLADSKPLDPRLKYRYSSCSQNYDDAISNLESAKKGLKSEEFDDLVALVKDVFQEIRSCENVFKGAPSDPAHIKKRNEEAELAANVVIVTTQKLIKIKKTKKNDD